jgi:hypothetical protein
MIHTNTSAQLPLAVAIVEGETDAARYIREGRPKRVPATNKPQALTSTAIYDGLAALYNDANAGALLVVDLPNKPTTGNLHKVLCGRDLERGVDYALFRAKADIQGNNFGPKQRPLVLEKLTDKVMKVPDNRAPQARVLADEAAARGVQDLRLLHAAPRAGETRVPAFVDLPMVFPTRALSPAEQVESLLVQGRHAEFNPLDAEADRELRAVRLPDLDMEQ